MRSSDGSWAYALKLNKSWVALATLIEDEYDAYVATIIFKILP